MVPTKALLSARSALAIRRELDPKGPTEARTLVSLADVSERRAQSHEKQGGSQKAVEEYQAAAELLEPAVRYFEQVGRSALFSSILCVRWVIAYFLNETTLSSR